jgi:hypothetical protein
MSARPQKKFTRSEAVGRPSLGAIIKSKQLVVLVIGTIGLGASASGEELDEGSFKYWRSPR